MQKHVFRSFLLNRNLTTKLIRVIKLTLCLMLIGCLSASATAYSQKLTLKEKDAPLQQVLKAIERQSDFQFFFADSDLQLAKRVTIDVKNMELPDLLTIVFKDQPLTWTISGKTILLKVKQEQKKQELTTIKGPILQFPVSGIVKGTDGKPLTGISIVVKGTTLGTTTDAEGKFSIDVEPGQTLVFSSIGFDKKELKITDAQTDISVVMNRKINSMDTTTIIVSNGYQKLPLERATGSFEFVDNKKLNEQIGPNIIKRLEGVTTSVLFDNRLNGSDASGFTIRGFSTILGNKSPLIILDNFPYLGDIDNINPNDVASITILKDAAAASIWGARAGNGVVVITTKRGAYEKPLQISFNANLSTQRKPDLHAASLIAPADVVDVQSMLFNNGFYDGQENSPERPALPPVAEILIAERDGKLSPDGADKQLSELRQHDIRDDYLKYIYSPSITQQYSLNISGGNNNSNYYLSGGYDRSQSNVGGISQRITLSSNYKFKVTKTFELNLGLNYGAADSKEGKTPWTLSGGSYLYSKIVDDAGNPLPLTTNYRSTYIDTAGGGKLLDWHYYPLTDWQHTHAGATLNNFQFKASFQYKIAKGLELSADYALFKQSNTYKTLRDTGSYYTRDLINSFTQIDWSTGIVTRNVPLGGILNISHNNAITQNGRSQLNFNNQWEKHAVAAVAGFEISQGNTMDNDYYTIYGYSDDPWGYSIVNNTIQYPNYITGYTSTIPGGTQTLPSTLNRFVSYFGNASYSYNNKYTFTISGRRDASNLFGVNTNAKWKPFWSTGIAWNIAKEAFYQSSFLPKLNFRATYGYAGNVDNTQVTKMIISYIPSDHYTLLPTAMIDSYGNPSLRWEKAATLNFGLDFGFKNDVITGRIEYYRKKDTDLYGPSSNDRTNGIPYAEVVRNAATMRGEGFEFQLNSRNINGALSWNTGFSFSYNTSTILKYNLQHTANSQYVGGSILNPIEGRPASQLISYKWNGLDPETGSPVGMLAGKPSMDYSAIFNDTILSDLEFKGSSMPTMVGNLSNNFHFKGFFLDINIMYKLGYYFFRPSVQYTGLFMNGIAHSDFGKRWRQPGDEKNTNVPSMIYPDIYGRDMLYQYSSTLVTKGDYIRLQYINLGYDFLYGQKKKGRFKDLNVYLNIANLGLIWKANKYGIDPDYSSTGIPEAKSFALGVKTTF